MIVFLCKNYNQSIIDFAKKINFCQSKVIIDNNEILYDDNVIFQIDDKLCSDSGYVNTVTEKGMMTHVSKNPNAWDKAMYFVCENDFEKCFIIEEDVFIPSVESLKKLFSIKSDLIIPRMEQRFKMYNNWNWNIIETKIDPPYFYSVVCAVGISSGLIQKIKEYKNKNGCLFNHEVMIPTIARQNNLRWICPFELRGIVAFAEWDISLFKMFPDYLFHPVKNIEFHKEIRQYIFDNKNNCMPISITQIFPKPYSILLIPKFLKYNKPYPQYIY